MPIYRGFDERLTSEVKRRFAAAPMTKHDYLGSNVDGESLEVAAWRLLLRSDGNPMCDGDTRALRAHLTRTIVDLEKRKVETIGIGIMDDAPRHFYRKFAILKRASELPQCVMGELRRILLA